MNNEQAIMFVPLRVPFDSYYASTVRALYKGNSTFSKGLFCPCLSVDGRLVGYPFGEGTEVAYEENVDVESTVALSKRPFLFLSR